MDFLKFFVSGLQKRKVLVSMKLCGLWRPEGQLFQIYDAGCLNKCSCNFLFVARVGLCCGFCDFAVSFLVPPDGPKNGTVKVLFFCSFTKLCMRSQKWDRQFLGPCLGSFFEVFCIRVAEAQSFGFNETLWLMATGRATVPNLYAGCLNKCTCNFLFVARVGLCILRFCGLIFGTA